ncbi:MAG: hypothetical protein DRN06_03760 [Thermoprotei archaeon]|nr:MAG: hypothetical protein DRN06_03760 [Thermoprotei archaeon]
MVGNFSLGEKMKTIKLKVDGREVEGIVVNKLKSKKRKRKVGNKEYEWVEYFIFMYVPKGWADKKLVLIGLD